MDNALKIINYLGKNIDQQFTMRAISNAIKIPYATFYRTLGKIENLMNVQTIGKSKTISLSLSDPIIKSYLAISSYEEKKEFLKSHAIINKIASELRTDNIVILFGSYAKGTETNKSDIDLLIINDSGNKDISFSKYEIIFKKKINPIFVTEKEFVDMLHDKIENVGKQALKGHIILQQPEHFWKCALHGRIQETV